MPLNAVEPQAHIVFQLGREKGLQGQKKAFGGHFVQVGLDSRSKTRFLCVIMATQTHIKEVRTRPIKYSGTIRLAGTISTTLAREIDAYGVEIGALTRTEAVVALVRKALDQHKAPRALAIETAAAFKGTMKEIISEVVEAERGLK